MSWGFHGEMGDMPATFRDAMNTHLRAVAEDFADHPDLCPCRGSGWICSNFDTWEKCLAHYNHQPHPENIQEPITPEEQARLAREDAEYLAWASVHAPAEYAEAISIRQQAEKWRQEAVRATEEESRGVESAQSLPDDNSLLDADPFADE